MDRHEAFKQSYSMHPKMQVQDGVKFLFQAEFGGGHMIKDEEASLNRLILELEETEYSDTAPIFESLGENAVRINLSAVKGKLSASTLNRIFVLSAEKIKGDIQSFEASLSILSDYFDKGDLERYLTPYKNAGCPAVSHTESYRERYAPAYRVISAEYVWLLSILMAIDSKKPRLIAIDGRCGSGKTTLSKKLSEIYDCNVFHADDFFLPLEMRTNERLSSPGGNMHRERLRDEIILPITEKRTAEYRKFICSSCTFSEPIPIKEKAINIVEGSYSLHPELCDLYDLRIFTDIDSAAQLERIKMRESDESVKAFVEKWIPLEERYFSACNVEKCADIVLR